MDVRTFTPERLQLQPQMVGKYICKQNEQPCMPPFQFFVENETDVYILHSYSNKWDRKIERSKDLFN